MQRWVFVWAFNYTRSWVASAPTSSIETSMCDSSASISPSLATGIGCSMLFREMLSLSLSCKLCQNQRLTFLIFVSVNSLSISLWIHHIKDNIHYIIRVQDWKTLAPCTQYFFHRWEWTARQCSLSETFMHPHPSSVPICFSFYAYVSRLVIRYHAEHGNKWHIAVLTT